MDLEAVAVATARSLPAAIGAVSDALESDAGSLTAGETVLIGELLVRLSE